MKDGFASFSLNLYKIECGGGWEQGKRKEANFRKAGGLQKLVENKLLLQELLPP